MELLEAGPIRKSIPARPIGPDKVMLIQNGLTAKLMIINKKTGKAETTDHTHWYC